MHKNGCSQKQSVLTSTFCYIMFSICSFYFENLPYLSEFNLGLILVCRNLQCNFQVYQFKTKALPITHDHNLSEEVLRNHYTNKFHMLFVFTWSGYSFNFDLDTGTFYFVTKTIHRKLRIYFMVCWPITVVERNVKPKLRPLLNPFYTSLQTLILTQ